jgi:CRP/FNR family cyclic AMP-dependent transcriptional regulator
MRSDFHVHYLYYGVAFVKGISDYYKTFPVKKFRAGQIILSQGEVPTVAYAIKKGVVKSFNITGEGEEKPIAFDVTNELFPIGWVFSKLAYAQFYYGAFTDCELYCIPRDDYIEHLQANPSSLYESLDYFISRYLNFQMRVDALEQSKASAKLLQTLRFLCLRFGYEQTQDVVKIKLPFTQQELANFMGLTRETTATELKKLQRKGVVSYRNQKYSVRKDRLNDLLDEEYEQGLIKEDESSPLLQNVE